MTFLVFFWTSAILIFCYATKFLKAYVTLKSKTFPIIHTQIHIVQEFDDIKVYALWIFFVLEIIMIMKSDADAVRNIFVDVNAVNIFLLLTLTPSMYFVDALSTDPGKKYLQPYGGD